MCWPCTKTKGQQAKAEDKLAVYKHKPAIANDIVKAVTPIYEELSNDILFSRCVGGFTQNNNESLNAMIWSFAPKRVFSGAKTVEVASYFAASIFNHGYESILQMMSVLNLQIGPNAVEMCDKADELRISVADKRSFETSKEGRIERRTARSALEEDFHEQEGSLLWLINDHPHVRNHVHRLTTSKKHGCARRCASSPY
ncbi:uncharacterized protein [Temnothorax nylanderi]|uniref:uncharacterized protein n=1 Tax=Temnothorax nylanderi TaxID=102681 RepID=UPI003A84566E